MCHMEDLLLLDTFEQGKLIWAIAMIADYSKLFYPLQWFVSVHNILEF